MICKPRAVKIGPGVGGSETGWAGRRHLLGEWGEQKKLLEQAVPCVPETARGELEPLQSAAKLWKRCWCGLQEWCGYTGFVPGMDRSASQWGWLASLPGLEWALSELVRGFLCCPCCKVLMGLQGLTMNLWSGWVLCGSHEVHGVNGIPYGKHNADTRVNACSPYLAFDLTLSWHFIYHFVHLQNEERWQQVSPFCMIGEKQERDWRDMEKESLRNRLTQVGEASRDEEVACLMG